MLLYITIKNDFHGFEFIIYHSLILYTKGNETPLINGRNFIKDKSYDINKYFQKNGYITGITNKEYSKNSWNPGWSRRRYGNYNDQELFYLVCDPFLGIYYEKIKGLISLHKKCIYGKMILEYEIEYMKNSSKNIEIILNILY